MPTTVRVLAAAFAIALVTGCGSIYYAPQTSTLAKLRITNDSMMGEAGAGIYDNPYCIGGKAVSFNAIRRGQQIDIPVDAGEPITFVVDGDRGSKITIVGGTVSSADIRRCQAPGRFVPQAGGHYEVVFHDDGKQCRVAVYEISSGSRQPAPSAQSLIWGRVPVSEPKGNCS